MSETSTSVLLLHLSDLHIDSSNQQLGLQPEKIADAMREHSDEHGTCVVTVTGDIARNGTEADYALALRFFTDLESSLRDAGYEKGARVVVVPGNHDCNLSVDARERLQGIREIRSSRSPIPQSRIEQCLAAQAEFFSFREKLCGAESSSPKVFWTENCIVDGMQLEFCCINTAWMSAKRDPQGQMRYSLPDDAPTRAKAGVVVSLIHHPLWWLRFSDLRLLRRYFLASSDLVLTGHEHDPDWTVEPIRNGGEAFSVAGGVFQHSPVRSGSFNVIRMSISAGEWSLSTMEWDADRKLYAASNVIDNQRFVRSRSFDISRFPVTERFAMELDNLEAPLRHNRRTTLRLSDVFIYPDLQEVRPHQEQDRAEVAYSSASDLAAQHAVSGLTVLCGEAQAGKTSLLRRLFRELHSRGIVPLLVRASDLKETSPDALKKVVYGAFRDQYGDDLLEEYKQCPSEEKCLLIDDLDEIGLARRFHARVIDRLHKIAGGIIATADEVYMLEIAEEASEVELLLKAVCYQIQRFRQVGRARLAEKWIKLAQEETLEEEKLQEELRAAESVMNRVFGRNLVPALPIVVLTVLQMRESPAAVDIGPGSVSYYFSFLVQAAMVSEAKHVAVDIQHGFLAELATAMLEKNRGFFTADEVHELHDRFEVLHATRVEETTLLKALERARLVVVAQGRLFFRYRYLLYYFAASYLSENLRSSERGEHARGWTRDLAARIDRADYANILVFMIHFSRDDFVVDQIVQAAESALSGVPAIEFGDDTRPLGLWLREPPKLAAPTQAPKDAREERRARADATEEEPRDTEVIVASDPDNPLLREHRAAYYAIGVLGQTLLHYPARLYASDKMRLMTSAYDVGRRAIFSLVDGLIQAEPLIRGLRATISYGERSKTFTHSELLSLSALRQTLLVIHRLVDSLGSDKLMQTYHEILKSDFTLPYRIVSIALKLEHGKEVGEEELVQLYEDVHSDAWTASLVRLLWLKRLFYNPPERGVVQRICDRLGIGQSAATRTRALGRKSRESKD